MAKFILNDSLISLTLENCVDVSATHSSGDLILKGVKFDSDSIVSTATAANGYLEIRDSNLYDPATGTYKTINKTGTCPFIIVADTARDASTDTITGTRIKGSQADDVNVVRTPVNYTPTSSSVEGHFAGIDTKLSAVTGNFVTLDTQQTITASKNFAAGTLIIFEPNLGLDRTTATIANHGFHARDQHIVENPHSESGNGVVVGQHVQDTTVRFGVIGTELNTTTRNHDYGRLPIHALGVYGEATIAGNNKDDAVGQKIVVTPDDSNTYTVGTQLAIKKQVDGSWALDTISAGGNFVTLDTAQTITGAKTFSSTITGSISGNAGTATRLVTSRTFTITGDGLTSEGVVFNGTVPVAIPLTFVTQAITDNSIKPATTEFVQSLVADSISNIDMTGYVTLDTAQTITGAKTFSANARFNAGATVSAITSTTTSTVINSSAAAGVAYGTMTTAGSTSANAGKLVVGPTATQLSTLAGSQIAPTFDTSGNITGWNTVSTVDPSNMVTTDTTQTITGTKTFSTTITGSISGNAGTATRLATARTLSITGDGVTSTGVSFSGTANAAIPLAFVTQAITDNTTKPATTAFVHSLVTDAIGDIDMSGYVTIATAQTITGAKTFSANARFNAGITASVIASTSASTAINSSAATGVAYGTMTTAGSTAANAGKIVIAPTATQLSTLAGSQIAPTFDSSGNITGWNTVSTVDPSNMVTTDTTQTITGAKTFSSTITGSISGNAGTATRLVTSRTFTITGDGLTSEGVVFNGTVPVAIPLTFVTQAITDNSIKPATTEFVQSLVADSISNIDMTGYVMIAGTQTITGAKTFSAAGRFNAGVTVSSIASTTTSTVINSSAATGVAYGTMTTAGSTAANAGKIVIAPTSTQLSTLAGSQIAPTFNSSGTITGWSTISASGNFVTLDTVQTITAAKTFSTTTTTTNMITVSCSPNMATISPSYVKCENSSTTDATSIEPAGLRFVSSANPLSITSTYGVYGTGTTAGTTASKRGRIVVGPGIAGVTANVQMAPTFDASGYITGWSTISASGNFVTLDTAQTITGAKTFSAATIFGSSTLKVTLNSNTITLSAPNMSGTVQDRTLSLIYRMADGEVGITGSATTSTMRDTAGLIVVSPPPSIITAGTQMAPIFNADGTISSWSAISASGNFVTLDTAQTITGAKTFTTTTTFSSSSMNTVVASDGITIDYASTVKTNYTSSGLYSSGSYVFGTIAGANGYVYGGLTTALIQQNSGKLVVGPMTATAGTQMAPIFNADGTISSWSAISGGSGFMTLDTVQNVTGNKVWQLNSSIGFKGSSNSYMTLTGTKIETSDGTGELYPLQVEVLSVYGNGTTSKTLATAGVLAIAPNVYSMTANTLYGLQKNSSNVYSWGALATTNKTVVVQLDRRTVSVSSGQSQTTYTISGATVANSRVTISPATAMNANIVGYPISEVSAANTIRIRFVDCAGAAAVQTSAISLDVWVDDVQTVKVVS